jgi:hypothetical protein
MARGINASTVIRTRAPSSLAGLLPNPVVGSHQLTRSRRTVGLAVAL